MAGFVFGDARIDGEINSWLAAVLFQPKNRSCYPVHASYTLLRKALSGVVANWVRSRSPCVASQRA